MMRRARELSFGRNMFSVRYMVPARPRQEIGFGDYFGGSSFPTAVDHPACISWLPVCVKMAAARPARHACLNILRDGKKFTVRTPA